MIKIYALIISCCILLSACQPPPQRMPLHVKEPKPVEAGSVDYRFEVTRVGIFEDDLAYDDERGVYLIKDHETGAEFVGVSGIGIAELGSHQSGKIIVEDER